MGYFEKYKRVSVPFMEGREKGSIKQLAELPEFHIEQFEFINSVHGEVPVFTVSGVPGLFFFGNSIIAEVMHGVREDGMEQALYDCPVSVKMVENAQGTASYWSWEFNED